MVERNSINKKSGETDSFDFCLGMIFRRRLIMHTHNRDSVGKIHTEVARVDSSRLFIIADVQIYEKTIEKKFYDEETVNS